MTNIFSVLFTIAYSFGMFGMLAGLSPYSEPGMEGFHNPDDMSDIVAMAFIFAVASQVPLLFFKNRKYHLILIISAVLLLIWVRHQ